jgi:hypothetical protein
MAITLTALLDNVAELPLKVGDDDLLVKYRPGKMTQALRNKLLRGPVAFIEDGNEQNVDTAWQAYYGAIAGLLVAWDLLGDDDKPLPINAETLSALPLGFVESLIGEVTRDSRVNPQTRATSASTLPTKDS